MRKKNAAFTIVWNDMIILKLWLDYYSRHFDDLYVIGFSTKETYNDLLAEWSKEYNMTFERKLGEGGGPEAIVETLKTKQRELLEKYKWVLYSDCDEFIVPDPQNYKDLREFMEKTPLEKTRCICYDVIQWEDEARIEYDRPYLQQRKYWIKDNNYNKTLLSKVPLNWVAGCHREAEEGDRDGVSAPFTGLYLLHLKWADLNPKEGRDFGPISTNLNLGFIEEHKDYKEEIPPKIREAF